MSALNNDFKKLTSCRDELCNGLASIKFNYIDLETCNMDTEMENYTIKEKVSKFDSSNLNLKLEIIKLSL